MNLLDAIFRAVIDISWRSSCLVLVVLALRSLLRGRLPARVLFWVWIAVAVRLLLPFSIPAAWSPFNLAHFVHQSNPRVTPGLEVGTASRFVAEPTSPVGSNTRFHPGDRFSSLRKLTPSQWTALIWGAGVVALLLARIIAYGSFARKLRRSRGESNPAAEPLLAHVAGLAGVHRFKVTVTDAVSTPALHGIFRPKLLFPPGFLGKLTPREIQLTVAHELAHDERRDLLVDALMHTAVTLHWFNPLAWVLARVARNDCELACDESVLRRLNSTERESYGATLLKIVSLANGGTPPPLGLGVVESKQQIKRRIQMIAVHQPSTFARTMLGCALFSVVTGLSLTGQTLAQPAPAISGADAPAKIRTVSGPDPSQWKFTYDPSSDGLNALFANGIVATVGDKVITVEDLRREIKPLLPMLQREARNQDDFNQRLNRLQNDIVGQLVGRVLLIKEYHNHKDGEEAKHIPESYIDNAIADTVKARFDNEPAKLLAYLQTRGVTMTDYRREVEEDIIYHYMQSQQRKLDDELKAQRTKAVSTDGKVHLRMIQLTRSAGETDAALLDKADVILARFKNGENFETLARELDQDQRRDKGGDWGWQGPADLKADYSEKLFALKKGEVSAPLVTKEGCFLLYAEDRR